MPPMDISALMALIRDAHKLAKECGIANVLQPGIIKELIIAEQLGHEVIPDKAKADATDADGNLYEYLSSLTTSNNFQIDRVTKENSHRITRNRFFYFAFFSDTITPSEIYEIDTAVVLAEANRQLGNSKNSISHMNLSGKWVRKNGRRIFPKQQEA